MYYPTVCIKKGHLKKKLEDKTLKENYCSMSIARVSGAFQLGKVHTEHLQKMPGSHDLGRVTF
jgi:hypothetical protein